MVVLFVDRTSFDSILSPSKVLEGRDFAHVKRCNIYGGIIFSQLRRSTRLVSEIIA